MTDPHVAEDVVDLVDLLVVEDVDTAEEDR
jgi:hypothetical protein